jgi:TPR repeat protein
MAFRLFGRGKDSADSHDDGGEYSPIRSAAVAVWYERSRASADTYDVFTSLMDDRKPSFRTDEEAAAWFSELEESGDLLATTVLGVMNEEGLCVPKSEEKAAMLYRKAAE